MPENRAHLTLDACFFHQRIKLKLKSIHATGQRRSEVQNSSPPAFIARAALLFWLFISFMNVLMFSGQYLMICMCGTTYSQLRSAVPRSIMTRWPTDTSFSRCDKRCLLRRRQTPLIACTFVLLTGRQQHKGEGRDEGGGEPNRPLTFE